jgi:DNA-binding IclR family transcriptional regulator
VSLSEANLHECAIPSIAQGLISFVPHAAISCSGFTLTFVRRRRQPFGGNIEPAADALGRE